MKLKLVVTTRAKLANLALVLVVLSAATVAVIPRAYAAGDDVFMDDGEGDFDSVPVPSSAPKKGSTTHQADAAPAPSSAVGDEASAVMSGDAAPAVEAPTVAHEAAPDMSTPVVEDSAPVAPEALPKTNHKSSKASHQAAHSTPHKKASSKVAAGKFLMTKDSCEMHREPASESAKMITVKASRKIWTEDVDSNWVRAYNKTGEPGFISKDCF